jgi:hypothetical protein
MEVIDSLLMKDMSSISLVTQVQQSGRCTRGDGMKLRDIRKSSALCGTRYHIIPSAFNI